MKPYVREDGYKMFILRRDNRSWHKKAHQLVIEAFVAPRPFEGAEVRHIDGTRSNDHFTNLEWGTSAQNKADMVAHGTRMQGESHPLAKLTIDQVNVIKSLARKGVFQREIAEQFGVTQQSVSRIVSGKRWPSHADA